MMSPELHTISSSGPLLPSVVNQSEVTRRIEEPLPMPTNYKEPAAPGLWWSARCSWLDWLRGERVVIGVNELRGERKGGS